MAAAAPPHVLVLCWLLRTACLAFPEEPGPLNFIPTEGNDLLAPAPEPPTLLHASHKEHNVLSAGPQPKAHADE